MFSSKADYVRKELHIAAGERIFSGGWKMVHLPVFYASYALLGLLRGKFYCHPVFLNTANRYQKRWYGLRRALRKKRTRFATAGKASRQRFFHPGDVLWSSGRPFCLPAAALLRVTDKP
jgi:hypothetical protein